MPLRLLHVVQTVNPQSGGPIEGIRQLAVSHRKYGHIVEIASLDQPDAAFLAFPGVPVHPLGRSGDRFFPFTLIRWLKANARHYDALIVNGIWGWHLLATWIAWHRCRVPYFVFTHGMLDPWFRRRYPLKHLKKWLVWPWAVYPVLLDAEAVLFTCEQEKLLARQSFWLYQCNGIVVKYGTQGVPSPSHDYASAFLAKHPAIAAKLRLLFLGRVHPKKAPDLLLKALADLKRKRVWDPATMVLVMAGPANGAYAKQLLHLAENLGIADSIYWSGMIQGDEKWGAFQSANAFVLPSHQENFGIAVVEALSCFTPVLISDAVNIAPEIAADGAGLVETDTRQGICTLLERWFALSPEARTTMKAKSRQCFEARYQIDTASTSITRAIYVGLLQNQLKSHKASLGRST